MVRVKKPHSRKEISRNPVEEDRSLWKRLREQLLFRIGKTNPRGIVQFIFRKQPGEHEKVLDQNHGYFFAELVHRGVSSVEESCPYSGVL